MPRDTGGLIEEDLCVIGMMKNIDKCNYVDAVGRGWYSSSIKWTDLDVGFASDEYIDSLHADARCLPHAGDLAISGANIQDTRVGRQQAPDHRGKNLDPTAKNGFAVDQADGLLQ